MARPLRIEVAGGWYHVTARGNERRAIFREDEDRRRFLALLEELGERFHVSVHAYVLMDNHYHLLLSTREANLSRAMQWLGVTYTGRFNRRYRRSGHLFQGRFHAVVMEETAAAEVSRYVHLNPVRIKTLQLGKTAQQRSRVGMLDKPDAGLLRERLTRLNEYRWSSYRAFTGRERTPSWLACKPVLELVGGPKKEQVQWRRRYRQFVEDAVREGLPSSPWERLEGRVVLGGAEFVARMRKLVRGDEKEQSAVRQLRLRPTFRQVVASVETLKAEKWEQWRDRYGDWGRDAVLWLGQKRCGMKLRELGEAVGGIDYRSVGTAIKNFEMRMRHDKHIAALLTKIEWQLQKQEM
jgi:REP element-mobilizing transposase RayT